VKTDSLFYKLFNTSPGIFFELIGRDATVGTGYEFRSVEIKGKDSGQGVLTSVTS
jgi:predicted transposase YdaD